MFAVIDCGTTNTRVYIVDEAGKILGQSAGKVGVRDVAVVGDNSVLKSGVRSIFFAAIAEANLTVGDIKLAVASGMITSEVGLIELAHNVVPCSLGDLAANVEIVRDETVTALPVPVVFVRGVKNREGNDAALADIRYLDFMRGEETQMMGLLALRRPELPVNIVMLGSHTKMIHIDAEGRIRGSMTSISGEMYESLTTTLIAKSMRAVSGEPSIRHTREEILTAAENSVRSAGFLRTLLMSRFMQVLMKTNVDERQLFIGAAIAAEDMLVFDELQKHIYGGSAGCILIGRGERCGIYRDMLSRRLGESFPVEIIDGEESVAEFTVAGATAIAKLVTQAPEK